MNNNPYQPPKAKLIQKEKGKGSAIKAIFIATLVDLVGTFILGIITFIGYSMYYSTKGLSAEKIAYNLENLDIFSVTALISIVIGCFITIYAGYLCAKIVNYSEYKFVSFYVLILLFVSFLMEMRYEGLGETIGFITLTFLCAYFGAWLHINKKQNSKSQSEMAM